MRTEDITIVIMNAQHIDTFCEGFNGVLGGLLRDGWTLTPDEFRNVDGQMQATLYGEPPLIDDFYPPEPIQSFLEQLVDILPEVECTLTYVSESYSSSDDNYKVVFVCKEGEVSCEGMDEDF